MAQTAKQLASHAARVSIGLCESRAAGMRLLSELDPPRPAVGKFPYPHRNCAQWTAKERELAAVRPKRRRDDQK